MLDYMPKAQRIWNCYRNRAVSYWLESNGVDVIPTVEWAEYSELEWCLDGLPKNSTLAVCTYGCVKNKRSVYGLLKGVETICRELSPHSLVMYGNRIESVNSLCDNVIWLESYCQTMRKRL